MTWQSFSGEYSNPQRGKGNWLQSLSKWKLAPWHLTIIPVVVLLFVLLQLSIASVASSITLHHLSHQSNECLSANRDDQFPLKVGDG